MKGVVAAGHPVTAEAGAQVLREGGNAIDAAVCAALTAFTAESPLTSLGAGGFMLVHVEGQGDHLLDFFVEAGGLRPRPLASGRAGRGRDPIRRDTAGVLRGAGFVRGAGNGRGSVGGGAPLREHAVRGARRAGCPVRTRRRAGHARAGLRVHHSRADPLPLSRDRRAVRARGKAADGGRRLPVPRPRRRPRGRSRRRAPAGCTTATSRGVCATGCASAVAPSHQPTSLVTG